MPIIMSDKLQAAGSFTLLNADAISYNEDITLKDFLDGKFNLIEETLIDGNIMDVSVDNDYYLCSSTVDVNIIFTVKTVKPLQEEEVVEIMDDGWNGTEATSSADRKTFTATISIPTGSTTDKRYFVTIKRDERHTQAKAVVIKRAYNAYHFVSSSENLVDITTSEIGEGIVDFQTIVNSSKNGATTIPQRTEDGIGDAKYLYYLVRKSGYDGSDTLSMTQYGFPAGSYQKEIKVDGEDYYVYKSSQKVTSHGAVQIQ